MRFRRARKKIGAAFSFFFVVKSGHFFGARFYAKGGAVHAKGGAACAANGVPWCRACARRLKGKGRVGGSAAGAREWSCPISPGSKRGYAAKPRSAAAQPRPCNVPRRNRDHAIAAQPL